MKKILLGMLISLTLCMGDVLDDAITCYDDYDAAAQKCFNKYGSLLIKTCDEGNKKACNKLSSIHYNLGDSSSGDFYACKAGIACSGSNSNDDSSNDESYSNHSDEYQNSEQTYSKENNKNHNITPPDRNSMSAEEYAKADENYWREKYKPLDKCFNQNSCQDYIDSIQADGITSSTCVIEKGPAPYDGIDSDGRTWLSRTMEHSYKKCVYIGATYYYLKNYAKAVEYYEKEDRANFVPRGLLQFAHAYEKTKQYAKAYAIENYGCQRHGDISAKLAKADKVTQENIIQESFYADILSLCNGKAFLMFHGQGTRQNQTEAIKIVKNICDTTKRHELLNWAIAHNCFYVATFYVDLKNMPLAKEYYGKACDLGDDEACEKYRILNQQGIKAPSEMPKPATKQSTLKSATTKPASKSQAK